MSKKSPPTTALIKKLPFRLIPVIITLLIRLWFILEMRNRPFSTITPQVVDSWVYHRWALEISQHSFFGREVFFLRPVYPYLLALLYQLFGPGVMVVQLFQALLATGSCYLLLMITERLCSPRVAFIAGIGFSLCGVLVFYTGTLLYVEITIFLSLLIIYLLLTANKKWWHFLLAGIGLGLFIICRPEMLLIVPGLIFWLKQFERARLRSLLIFAIAGLMVIITVPVRNYLVARDPVLFTAHSGINFYFGNNPAADGTWQPVAELNPGIGFSHQRLKQTAKYVNGQELSWSRASAYWTSRGIQFITSQPVRFLKLLSRKLLLFFANYEVPNNYYPETVRPASRALQFAFINFGLVLSFALLGIGFCWKIRYRLPPVYLFIGGYLMSALLFYVLSRLRAPILPWLLIPGAAAVTECWQLLQQRKFKLLFAVLTTAALIYLGSNLVPINRNVYSAQAWTQLGNIYLELKKPGPAIQALNKALHYYPGQYSARYSLIQAYAGMHRLAEAEREFQQLLNTTGNSPDAQQIIHLAAARIGIARRNFPAALEHYQAALKIDPNNPETYYLIALVNVSIGDIATAKKYLSLTLQLDPDHDAARSALLQLEQLR